MNMERASNVEFNAEQQIWEARDPSGRLLCSNAERDKCLEEEKAIVDKMIAQRVAL